ncbi:unnamed protein product [Citrullus colocynthis]|uniref:Uncharacterized protein n=1 Tax=Citrullus colocynthis TaxID=252529 RepID=A0ABP0YH35_9ROSI
MPFVGPPLEAIKGHLARKPALVSLPQLVFFIGSTSLVLQGIKVILVEEESYRLFRTPLKKGEPKPGCLSKGMYFSAI